MSRRDEMPVGITEQRLRDAFAAAADTVAAHTVRDLARPAARPGRPRNRLLAGTWYRPRRCAWERQLRPPRLYQQALTPLAAAAAVAFITATMTVIMPKAFSGTQGAPPVFGPGTHRVPGRAVGRPVARVRPGQIAAGYVGGRLPSGAPPRFFVGIRQLLIGAGQGAAVTEGIATGLTVYSSVTGRVVARVTQPGRGLYYQAVAALGSDQKFVVAAVPVQRSDCYTRLYQFSLGPQGQPTRLEPLSVPEVIGQIAYTTSLATSADGSVLAYAVADCTRRHGGQVGVIHLATGKKRTWSTLFPSRPRNLSLSANGALLSFVSNPGRGPATWKSSADAAWLLPTSAPSGSLASYSRRMLYVTGGVQSAVLSPTGEILFAMLATRSRRAGLPEVDAYKTGTGKLIGLVQFVSSGSYPPGLSPDRSGQYALVYPLHLRFVQRLNLVTGQLGTVTFTDAYTPVGAAW